jgi:hypothetical protein
MMSLMALVLMPHFGQSLDQGKVLKMIILHDLAEALTEDMPVWEGVVNKTVKLEAEQQAIEKILQDLDPETKREFLDIWEEYELRESMEAKFVKLVDTFDVVTQHNAAPITTWDDNDFLWQLSELQDSFFNLDPEMRRLKDELDQWSIQKVSEEDKLEKLDQAALRRRVVK